MHQEDCHETPTGSGCIYGAVRYEITQASVSVYTCHCTDCQRATVGACSIGIAVPGDAFRLSGEELQPAAGGVTAGGRVKTRWVCPDCGIGVIGGVEPGTEPPGYTRIVRAGTLDDTSWVRPTTHFWTRSKQPWVVLPEGDVIYETQPLSG